MSSMASDCEMSAPLLDEGADADRRDDGLVGPKKSDDYGEQRIGLFQSTCLLVNNVTGAAMVLYPTLLQQAGWFTPLLAMLVVASLSAIAGLCLIKAMQLIPQNEQCVFVTRLLLVGGRDIALCACSYAIFHE
jgi:hypothetical protein